MIGSALDGDRSFEMKNSRLCARVRRPVAALALALGVAGCGGSSETSTGGPPTCTAADLDGLRVASSDPLSTTPYTLGYPPYSVDACQVAYVAEAAAGEAAGPLWLRDLVTGEEIFVAPAAERPRRPSLVGDILAWEADVDGVPVVRVRAAGQTVTLTGAFHHAGEPRAAVDGVVLTGFLEESDLGDADIFFAAPGESAAQPFFVGPGQQRFADVSASHVAFTDFSEDPDGRFDANATDLADIVVQSRDTGAVEVRGRPGKQAFPLLGAGGHVAYLEWAPEHPEPKLSAYTLLVGNVSGPGDADTAAAAIRTVVPYVRPAAAADRLTWVHWPEGEAPTFWTRPVDLSAPAERVADIEGPALLGPAVSAQFDLAIVLEGGAAALRAAAR